jgi:tetratricopeptide (TPR) repeat protein
LFLRKHIVELNPQSSDDKLALVQIALVANDYSTATNTLASVKAEDKKSAAFHSVAGTVAEAAGRMQEAEGHFVEVLRLQPANQAIQLDLAMVRLLGTNKSAKADSRTALARIAADQSNPAGSAMALRELIMDAVRSQNLESALGYSRQLVQMTNSLFGDKLLRLDLSKKAASPDYNRILTEVQRAAATDSGDINTLVTWQLANISLDSTLAWLRSLPVNTQTNQPATILIAKCLASKQDWLGLRTWVEKQNWGEVDFLRHAYLARALREQNLSATSDTEWELAVKLASNDKSVKARVDKPNLVLLLGMAAQWGWQGKGEEILWSIVGKYPSEQWANNSLVQLLFTSGRTRPLMMLYTQQLNWKPTDLSVKNNLAMCALLLEAQELKPNDLAREVFEKEPDNPSNVSTYAFSLHLQKKDAEALKVIEKLKPDELKSPSIAGYYGLILAATGNPAKAKAYLNLVGNSNLLPEERKLFDKAKSGL